MSLAFRPAAAGLEKPLQEGELKPRAGRQKKAHHPKNQE